MKGLKGVLLFFGVILLITSCSEFRKIQKSPDWKVKYNAALKYYQSEDYYKASLLLEDILPIIRGSKEAELGNFYLAYCYYHRGQYLLSAHHFQEFVNIFGRSKYVMEARYKKAHSLYLMSPPYELDQQNTVKAINEMQGFINNYPTSKYAKEADSLIDEMQQKLEKKNYEKCKLYYKLRQYKSGLITYDNFAKDFPDSKYREEVTAMKVETAYDLAKRSIRSKQKERYQTTIDNYLKFIDRYPSSNFSKKLESYYSQSLKEITKFAD